MAVIQLLKYLLMAIPVVMILCAVLLLMRHGRENLFRLVRNGIRILKRRSILVFLFAAAYGGIYLGVRQLQTDMQASVIIGFNYPEASIGLNPNSTRFNISELLSDGILEKAITEGNLNNVSVDDLKRCFNVTPLKAGDSISADQIYMSTEYQLTYEANENTLHLVPADVVNAVARVYCREFVDTYSRKTNVLTTDFSELEDMDYLDMVELFDSRAEDLSDYAYAMSGEAPAFQSETTGETFSSISEKVQSFRDVQLESLQAFILVNGLAKDAGQYVAKLNYDNTITHKEYLKNVATHKINLDAIDRYERDMARIVLIPSQDLDGEFYMSRTKIGVDYFAENAEVSMQNAAKRQHSIQSNEYAITQMQSAAYGNAQVAQAEELLESVKSEYQVLSRLLEDTLADYDRKTTNNYVSTISVHPASIEAGIVRAAMLAAIFAVSFCALIVARNGRSQSLPDTAREGGDKKRGRIRKRAKAGKGDRK